MSIIILQFDQRIGNQRDFRGNFRVGSSEAALTLEGPLFKNGKNRANTTFIVSARRSYLQLLFKLIELPILPDYWDFQYKINHKINDYNEIFLTGIASIDDFRVNELSEFDPEQQAFQDQVPVIKQQTNTVGLSWKRRFKDDSGIMTTTASTNMLNNSYTQYSDNINQTGVLFENDSREQEVKLRLNVTKFARKWTTSYGLSTQYANYKNNTVDLVNNFDYNTTLDFVKYGLFFQTSTKLANDRVGLSLGLRADGNTFTDTGNELYRTLSPRAAISYKLTPDGTWNANFTVGRYYKLAPYTVLGFQDNDGQFANKSSEYIRSDHIVAGVEYLLSKSSRFAVEGFVKLYDNYPVSLTDSVSLANKGGGFEVLGNEPIESVGKGRTYGAEFLYQQKFTGNFYAIAAYTLYWSQFTGFDRDVFLPSSWDSRHLISFVGGFKAKKNWEFSARYRFLGPAPFAAIDEEATLENYPAQVLDYSNFGEERLDPFSQLDVRVDKKWNFKNVSFDIYLDVENVLGSSNPQEPVYGLDRDENGEIKTPNELILVNEGSSGTVLPSLGIVLNF